MYFYEKMPNSLSKEEQEKLLIEYKQNGNLEAREKLIKHNLKLVMFVIKKYFNNTPYEKNELFSVGIVGLINSVDKFDIQKKQSFSTYASKCIYNEILKTASYQNRINEKEIQLEAPLKNNEEEDDCTMDKFLFDNVVNIEEDYEKKEQILLINQILKNLTEKEKDIIAIRFGFNDYKPHTVREIATIYHISHQRAFSILKNILEKIKLQLNCNQIQTNEKQKTIKK